MTDDVTLLYFDADGKPVAEGDDRAAKQYRSDDPARPDAKAAKPAEAQAVDEGDIEAVKVPAAKAIAAPAANKARSSSENK